MATITVEGGPSNWREAFLAHPGLAVTPENHDRLLAAQEAAQEVPEPVPAPEPEPEAAAVPDRPAPRTPPRRPPAAPDSTGGQ